jgi:hypothetical protein
LDYRIRSKIQYWGYMKGSTTVTGSLIPRTAPLMLPVGEIMLDRGTYGNVNLGPLQARPRVRVSFPLETGNPEAWDYRNIGPICDEILESQQPENLMTCPYCGHTWIPRTDYPKRCPECYGRLVYAEVEV